ncbi:GDP-mannose mannosyl hydrolase [Acinetobacter cumulans]|uniref:GDP-mannose mannosyl hydrolase n=1 Tax=Acinetobacter cumulans TaxID=2136182 RepID=A0ABX9U778_9GAMM|nr:GDP-mannose mannosyl hydrolase [Acinetobacter cumulans]RLL47437.1 GDP-mannose mannosyl hydrolase [Acinetobacter cumulans]
MWLPDETFKSVIQHTPLISIDLIVRNEQGEVLLGKRVNAPAKGYWFVPGGRVRKNETLDDAFVRLVREELGIESGITRADAKFLGVFEHFYDDCVFSGDVSTHYIVLGYEITLKYQHIINLREQHEIFEYLKSNVADSTLEIHYFTRLYLE